jgi:hypothetical protein
MPVVGSMPKQVVPLASKRPQPPPSQKPTAVMSSVSPTPSTMPVFNGAASLLLNATLFCWANTSKLCVAACAASGSAAATTPANTNLPRGIDIPDSW